MYAHSNPEMMMIIESKEDVKMGDEINQQELYFLSFMLIIS